MNGDKFVIDTNVLMSAFMVKNSVSSLAFDHALRIGSVIQSHETFNEFVEVINRPKFDKYFTGDKRERALKRLEQNSIIFEITIGSSICRDPKDDKFLYLATEANAACIISGDQDLLEHNPFKEILILQPQEFLLHF